MCDECGSVTPSFAFIYPDPDSSSPGSCPDCGQPLPSGWTLITFERDDRSTGVFAECPSCGKVVRPSYVGEKV
ncbi:DUF7837 family putative zinc-binding protein [Salinigranum halophilum]